MIGYWIGWAGVVAGVCVPIPQLIKIIKTHRLADVSLGTYTLLIFVLLTYLWHAIYIRSEVFATAQAINLTTNGTIWVLLLRHRIKRGQLNWLKRLLTWR